MSLKRSDKNTNGTGSAGADAADQIPKYRDNVEINAKIDASGSFQLDEGDISQTGILSQTFVRGDVDYSMAETIHREH
jgi:hypothetical protein